MARKENYQFQESPKATPAQEDNFAEIRRKRKEDAEAKKAEKKATLDQREEFRKFFARINGKLKLEKSMEQIIWIHFKASGHAEKEKFEDGIRHFGYKL